MTISPRFLELVHHIMSDETDVPTFTDISYAWGNVCRYHVYPHTTLMDLAKALLRFYIKEVHGKVTPELQQAVVNELIHVHTVKNAAYAGNSEDPFFNFRNAQSFGVTAYTGCLIRMADKMQRYVNLRHMSAQEKDRLAEEDTLLDLLSYTLIAQCLYDEQQLPHYVKKEYYNDATFDGE